MRGPRTISATMGFCLSFGLLWILTSAANANELSGVGHYSRILGDFNDNTLGYCDLEPEEIERINKLMLTPTSYLRDEFFNYYVDSNRVYEYPIENIRGFLKLVREYLNPNANPSDRQILDTMTIKTVVGRDETLTPACQSAITSAISETTVAWFELMGVGQIGILEDLSNGTRRLVDGTVFDFMEDAAQTSDPEKILPLFLDIMEADGNIFNRFVATILLQSAVINVKTLMDEYFPKSVSSWKEAAATAQSFTAKYAAFAVTEGIDLIDPFFALGRDGNFENAYNDVVNICSITLPTGSPSSSPTLRPADLDQFLPMIAVVEQGGPSASALEASWRSFRQDFPNRPFCILKVRGSGDILAPTDMLQDPNVIYKFVNRDNGDVDNQSDWFDLCDLYRLNTSGRRLELSKVDTIVLLVDLVHVADVQASYNLFLTRLDKNNIEKKDATPRADKNWIRPFNRVFLDTTAPSSSPSMQPSSQPTSSVRPSSRPSNTPSAPPSSSPSTRPSATPSAHPSSTPSATPSTSPSSLPSTRPSGSPSSPSAAPSESPSAPSVSPSASPSVRPSSRPSAQPSLSPSTSPSERPSTPSASPSASPSVRPSSRPSAKPSLSPSAPPSAVPSRSPSARPSSRPSSEPSGAPNGSPSNFFDVDLRFQNASPTDQTAVETARNRIERIIVGDVPSATGGTMSTNCGTDPAVIDDLNICVRFRDLEGNVIGLGGPRRIRTNSPGTRFPITGEISIDPAFHTNNPSRIISTSTHEMLHVLGIGILWDNLGIAVQSGSTCTYQLNSAATREFRTISGCSFSVPVRGDCAHWDESCFASSELMGPFGGPRLSRITVGSLQDLGFSVDYSQADPLSVNNLGSRCRCSANLQDGGAEDGAVDGVGNPVNVGYVPSTTGSGNNNSGENTTIALPGTGYAPPAEEEEEPDEPDAANSDPVNVGYEETADGELIEIVQADLPDLAGSRGGGGGGRRQLSEEGRAAAVAIGLSELAKNREEIAQQQSLMDGDASLEEFFDLGCCVMSVLYLEDGIIYDVIVWEGDVDFRRYYY